MKADVGAEQDPIFVPDAGSAFKTGGLNPIRLDLPADIAGEIYWEGFGFLFLVIGWPVPFMLANAATSHGFGSGLVATVAIATYLIGLAAGLGWQFRLKPRLQARETRKPVARITSDSFIRHGAPHLTVRWDDILAVGLTTGPDGDTAVFVAHLRTPRPRVHRGRLIRNGAFWNRRLNDDEIELPLQGFHFSAVQMQFIYETMVRRAGGRLDYLAERTAPKA